MRINGDCNRLINRWLFSIVGTRRKHSLVSIVNKFNFKIMLLLHKRKLIIFRYLKHIGTVNIMPATDPPTHRLPTFSIARTRNSKYNLCQ